MTQQEIIEGNKLIAEFMGLKWKTYEGSLLLSNNNGKSWFGKLYDKEWSQLMPVVEKIATLESPYKGNVATEDIHEIFEAQHRRVVCLPITTPITSAWESVTQFLKWFNSKI